MELYRTLPKTGLTQLNFHKLFKPIRKIGSGLTATVYKVRRVVDGAIMAVKAFKKSEYFQSQGGRGRVLFSLTQEAFARELSILRELDHPGLSHC